MAELPEVEEALKQESTWRRITKYAIITCLCSVFVLSIVAQISTEDAFMDDVIIDGAIWGLLTAYEFVNFSSSWRIRVASAIVFVLTITASILYFALGSAEPAWDFVSGTALVASVAYYGYLRLTGRWKRSKATNKSGS